MDRSQLLVLRTLDWEDAPSPASRRSSADLEESQVIDTIRVAADTVRVEAVTERGGASSIRLRANSDPNWDDARRWLESQSQAERFVEHMGEDHLGLSMALHCLEHDTRDMPYDPSTRAAFLTLQKRVRELTNLSRALDTVYDDTSDPRMLLLLGTDEPLHVYLKGLHLFSAEVVAALAQLAAELRVLQPDWGALRHRLDEARDWHFESLTEEIREDLARLPIDPTAEHDPLADVAEHLEELFWDAATVCEGLKERFG